MVKTMVPGMTASGLLSSAGVKMIGKMKWYLDQLEKQFTKEEIEMLSGFCGGYIVFNLKKW